MQAVFAGFPSQPNFGAWLLNHEFSPWSVWRSVPMSRLLYRSPAGQDVINPSSEILRALILTPPADYWLEGSGDGELEFVGASPTKTRLLILPHNDFGFYLKYLEIDGKRIVKTRLSLGDRNRLSEVTMCSDAWLASVGLFLRPSDAANAIEDFALTGERSDRVEWIEPEVVPPEGNW